MENRDKFSRYLYNLHEVINKMLHKKSNLSYDDVRERYEHFRARCVTPSRIKNARGNVTLPRESPTKVGDLNRQRCKDKDTVPIIYFHKTTQEPEKIDKLQYRCYFHANQPIQDIADINCLNTTRTKMSNWFPATGPDLEVITELVRRPFYGVKLGGRMRMRGRTTRRLSHRCRRSARATKCKK